jgi:DNA-binding NarL/FixJ family response regulator
MTVPLLPAAAETSPVRLLLVDDHAVVRAGLAQLLGTTDDLQVVGAAADGAEAVALARSLHPDVVLMDLSMPGVDGTEATRQIAACCPTTRVVALTSFSDPDRILAAFDAGAVGYLLKDAAPEDIFRAVRQAADGQAPVDPKVAQVLLGARSRTSAPAASGLTAREQEVLALLSEGCANKHIARRLGISEATVKAHLTSIFRTIGVADRTQAALWAQRQGLSSTRAATG